MERSKPVGICIDDGKRQVVNVITWEQRKFSDYYKMSSGYAFKMSDYCEDGIGLINGESIQHGIINDDNLNHLPESFIEQYPDFILKEGDIVVGLNRPITNGNLKIARIPSKYNDSLLYQRAGKVVYKEECDRDFSYVLLSQEILKHTLVEAVGSDQPFISTSKLDKWQMMIPKDIEEQHKIGEYFSNLDNLITLHQRKCDEMKKMKKFMLQKMFPKNGQKNPEIRFDGFTDDWEQRKLGEVVEKVTTKNNDTQYIETFTNSAELGIMSQREYFDHDVSNIENISGYYIVENDAFVYNPRISTSAPVGPINRNKLGRTGVMSPLYTVFKVNGIDSEYLEWYFKSTGWHSFMKFNGDSGARSDRFSIKDSVFFEMPIPTPDIDEQEKIGEYFSSLDHLITLHQRKVENLKNLKKYMLQNMFV